jgi:RNA polymerase sigma-70 factor (ECF subfamily)
MAGQNGQQDRTGSSGTDYDMASLIISARAGDRVAFGQVVDQFYETIFRMVYFRTRSRMDAEDLTQDIFIKAFKNLSRLKEIDRFRAWLFRIAVNRINDFHRKRRIMAIFKDTEENPEDDPQRSEFKGDQDPLDHATRREFWEKVKSFSKNLSAGEREVFFLRFMDHLSIKEISQVLNRSESTIKTYLYRGLKKFRADSTLLQILRG